jgi:hypothetical protein
MVTFYNGLHPTAATDPFGRRGFGRVDRSKD